MFKMNEHDIEHIVKLACNEFCNQCTVGTINEDGKCSEYPIMGRCADCFAFECNLEEDIKLCQNKTK